MAVRRTERLLNLLIALLNTRYGRSKEYLRSHIAEYSQAPSDEAFERMFERDKADLRALGIPLQSQTEHGAFAEDLTTVTYRVPKEEYRLPKLQFSVAESAALSVATKLWDQASLSSEVESAFRKLQSSAELDDEAHSPVQPRLTARDPGFSSVLEALALGAAVAFDYQGRKDAQPRRRTVQPWGMGQRFGGWYLVGFDADREDQRIFRLSRMTSEVRLVNSLGHSRPESFSLHRTLSVLERADQTARIEIAVDRALGLRAQARPVDGESSSGSTEAWDAFEIDYRSLPLFAGELASYGDAVRVVEPAELRHLVRQRLMSALSAESEVVPDFGIGTGEAESGLPENPVSRKPNRATSQDRLRRLIDLVPFLVHHQGLHLNEIAAEFGISRAQLEKDLELIMVTGLPGGLHGDLMDVRWEDGYVYINDADDLSEPIRFTIIEASALMVGLQILTALPGLDDGAAVHSALAKISSAADQAQPGMSDQLTEAVDVSLGPSPTLAIVSRALNASVSVHFDYLAPYRDDVSHRTVDPVRLFSQHDTWYLQGFCHDAQALRLFRIDRIRSARLGDTVQSGHHDVELPEQIFTPSQQSVPVEVIGSEREESFLEDYGARVIGRAENTNARWQWRATFQAGNLAWLPALVARSGGGLRVIAPTEAVTGIREFLQRAVDSLD